MIRDRQPLLLAFAAVAVIVAVLALANRSSEDVDASFGTPGGGEQAVMPTAQPLPTPSAGQVPDAVESAVQVLYSSTGVTITGVVPAEPILDALRAAAVGLVGADAVVLEVGVDPSVSLDGSGLALTGEVADAANRAAVVAAFANLGLIIDDQLTIAGENRTVSEVIAGTPRLSQFADFVALAGVAAELDEMTEAGLTVFAPTNRALESVNEIALGDLSDPESLASLLRYHVVERLVRASDLLAGESLTTRQGESIAVTAADDGGEIRLGGARIVVADIEATNGVVHVIDTLLLPGTLRTEVRLNEIVGTNPIQFGSGSAEIADASLAVLDRVAAVLGDNPRGVVEIQGHTDSDGDNGVNRALSQRRADAVRAYLIEQGVDASRLEAKGYGESRLLVDPERNDRDRRRNRRIEFRVRG